MTIRSSGVCQKRCDDLEQGQSKLPATFFTAASLSTKTACNASYPTATSVTIYEWSTKVQRVRCVLSYMPQELRPPTKWWLRIPFQGPHSHPPIMQPTLHLLVHQVVDVLRRWKWLGKLQKQSFPTTHEDTHCIPPSWMLKQAKYGQVCFQNIYFFQVVWVFPPNIFWGSPNPKSPSPQKGQALKEGTPQKVNGFTSCSFLADSCI